MSDSGVRPDPATVRSVKRKVYGVFTATIVLGLAVAATVGVVERSFGWALVVLFSFGLACLVIGTMTSLVALRVSGRVRR